MKIINEAKLLQKSGAIFFKLSIAIKEILKTQKGNNISFNQLRILNILRQEKVTTANEIAEIIGITPASMAVNIDYLIENKLVTSRLSKSDKRVKSLRLTMQGKTKLIKIGKRIVGEFSKMLNILSESEVKQFLRIIDKIESNI